MKILIAITNKEPEKLAGEKSVLTWVARSGFDVRVFGDIGDNNAKILARYKEAFDDVNYQAYVDVDLYTQLVTKQTIAEYAKIFKYDLLIEVPEDTREWNATKNKDLMVLEMATDIAHARKQFSKDKDKTVFKFENDLIMKRL